MYKLIYHVSETCLGSNTIIGHNIEHLFIDAYFSTFVVVTYVLCRSHDPPIRL